MRMPFFGKYAPTKRFWIYNNVDRKEFMIYLRWHGKGYACGFNERKIFGMIMDLGGMVLH